jgi:hypothetical protein
MDRRQRRSTFADQDHRGRSQVYLREENKQKKKKQHETLRSAKKADLFL